MVKNPDYSHEEEQEPLKEMRIGGGEVLRITKATEEIERQVGNSRETAKVQLSKEELDEISEELLELPFRVGSLGDYQKEIPIHEVEMTITPYGRGAPKGKETYLLVFDFKDPKVWASGLSYHSVKNLTMSNPAHNTQSWSERQEGEQAFFRIGFSPEKKLTVGGKKIQELF